MVFRSGRRGGPRGGREGTTGGKTTRRRGGRPRRITVSAVAAEESQLLVAKLHVLLYLGFWGMGEAEVRREGAGGKGLWMGCLVSERVRRRPTALISMGNGGCYWVRALTGCIERTFDIISEALRLAPASQRDSLCPQAIILTVAIIAITVLLVLYPSRGPMLTKRSPNIMRLARS